MSRTTIAVGRRLTLAAVIVLSLAGCADPMRNGILEVDLALPPNPAPADAYAVIEVLAGRADFTALWTADDRADGFALTREPSAASFSVIAERELDYVSMKVRFCGDARCALDPEGLSPEVHVSIEHPLYLGEYTGVAIEIDTVPTPWDTIEVDACDVRGCSEDVLASYCDDAGRHLCAVSR